MDWKEFAKKYGIYIVAGLIVAYFLLRRPSGQKQSVSSRPSASGGNAGPRVTGGPVSVAPRQTSTAPLTARPNRPTGGSGGIAGLTNLITTGVRGFVDIFNTINRTTATMSRTPSTFPGRPRVPSSSPTSNDGLIRIIDASGVETVIASGYYDVPEDFGISQADSMLFDLPGYYPADFGSYQDNGTTFGQYSGPQDIFGELFGWYGDGGYSGSQVFGGTGESEYPEITYGDYAVNQPSFDYSDFFGSFGSVSNSRIAGFSSSWS